MKHIGIVGCSAEGAALCYRTICLEAEPLMGRHNHPELTLHTIPLASYMEGIETENWQQVAELILRSADALESAGADFLICPDNTIHQALPDVLPRCPGCILLKKSARKRAAVASAIWDLREQNSLFAVQSMRKSSPSSELV